MPKLKSNPMIVLNNASEGTNLELFVASNLPIVQVKDGTTINPSWENKPLVLSPSVYVNNVKITNPTITWQRRSGGGDFSSTLISGESVSNNILTVNKNVLVNDTNKIITYKCTVIYDGITKTDEKSFSLSVVGSSGTAGQSVFVTYNDSSTAPSTPTGNGTTNGWHTSMTSSSVWMSVKTAADISSGTWGEPVRIKGADGKGITNAVVTYQASSSGSSIPTGEWVSNIPTVSSGQYLWTRTVTSFTDGTSSTGYSIGKIGENGTKGNDGKGIKSTEITYQAHTSGTAVPTGTWTTAIPNVAANQYLWTKTTITYTDNTTISSYSIGKMGATGESSVSFEIYSDTGLVFHNEDQITLKTQKLYGFTTITIGGSTTIQWSKMTQSGWVNTWKYDSGDTNNVITNTETLVVKSSEVDGSQLYRCTLTYGGKTYTDIVTITDKSDVYQSKIVSIGGNVLHGGEIGITAYASLYHGADEEDTLKCPIYSQGTTPVSNQAYYVLDNSVYVIKKYVSNAWVVDTTIKQDHLYSWFIVDKYTGEQQSIGSGKVIYITNDVISKSGIVQCKIDNISMCTESFTDANDPIIGSEQPSVTTSGQLWLNTDDGILYAYKEASASWEPVNSGQNRTYTSAPVVKYDCCFYKKGDLWIVGDNDSAYTDAKPGTLLVAINGLKDGAENWGTAAWKDRLAVDWDNKLYYDETINSITDYQQKLSAYMNFEADGLKIGANNTEFYTKVTPYDLGFYQGPEKVAYVSNKKMYNTSLEVSNDVQILKHKSDEQPNPQKPYFMLGNFKFIIEENGSMSIARSLMTSPQPRVRGYNISGKIITIYFTPWSSNVSYGYKSNHDATAIGNIQLLNDEGTALTKTTATGAGYIRITSSANLPKNIRIVLPYHVVYNIGQANSDYDLTDVGSDAITLAIATDV